MASKRQQGQATTLATFRRDPGFAPAENGKASATAEINGWQSAGPLTEARGAVDWKSNTLSGRFGGSAGRDMATAGHPEGAGRPIGRDSVRHPNSGTADVIRTFAGESRSRTTFLESMQFINRLVEDIGDRITAHDIAVARRISTMSDANL